MARDSDALNYPYIRIRDVEWLKRTLLVFPHVARIAPSYGAPEDSPEVRTFLELEGRRGPLLRNVNLYASNIWKDQFELKARISEALSARGDKLLAKFGRPAAHLRQRDSRSSRALWNDRIYNGSFQLHRQKVVAELLEFLLENGLAWEPIKAHGAGYVEMHPQLGEAVLATLAFACARNEGLHLVTEFPDTYERTIHCSKEEIIESCLELDAEKGLDGREVITRARLAEFFVYHRCDVSKLTAENLVALNHEWEAIAAFRDGLEKLAAEIPESIEDPDVLRERLAEKADAIFTRWRADNKNWSQRLKDLFSGDLDDVAKALEKALEKGIGGAQAGSEVAAGVAGGVLGATSSNLIIGAGAGLAVALLVRTRNNILAKRKRLREDPLRYLTMMEKAGVSYVVSG